MDSFEPFFTLTAKSYGGGVRTDYLNLLRDYLRNINIELDIQLLGWWDFFGFPPYWGADVFYVSLSGGGVDPDFTGVYNENGSLNNMMFGYHTSMDWDEELGTGKNEWYIQNGLEMISNDSQEQINQCWEWQHYMMNELLPCLPLFSQTSNRSTYELLFYNLHESRPVIGSDQPAVGFSDISLGLVIRKAISYAINREEIRKVVLGDDYEIIHHPTNPTLEEWLNPSSIRYCYNLDAARELMYIAGYQVGWWDVTYPDWQEVCPNNPTTISVSNYGFRIATECLMLISIIFLCNMRRKKKLGGKNE